LSRVLAIMSEELAGGFTLTGLDVIKVRDPARGREALLEAVGNPEYGLLIVEQSLLETFDERNREALLARNVPLIIPIPGELRWSAGEQPPADEYVAALIRRAVGYQLNIKL
jgi:vacuolar-type H+-ATPase subunit F/Vma7